MSKSIDFYFDFSSPYGYLASTRIEAIAEKHGCTVDWHPILLGAIFKISGQAPLISYPLKGDYALKDFERAAREYNTPFKQPSTFPISSVAASRACYWVKTSNDAALKSKLTELVHALFSAYYVDDKNLGDADEVITVAQSIGIDKEALVAGLQDQTVKDALRTAVDGAMDKGIFGSPTSVVDNELFWGSDRLEQLDRWLTRGGW